jgi:Restriction Enzyme Adenine Methylase Associated
MARTVGTMTLGDLVERGVLKPRERLVLRRRSKPEVTASLRKDGSIKVGEAVYTTPTAAARQVTGRPADGWLRWRVPRLSDQTLAEVRDSND